MTGHIFIEGEIGTDVTVKTVRADIANYPQAKSFEVHVNSGGGDVYEGQAIASIFSNELRRAGIKTDAKIGALCASIATFIAESCDRVEMGPHGDFMIHLPTGSLTGNADDLRKGAAQLDRITSELIDKYMTRVARKGVTREKLAQMITQETSMSPQEAEAYGFIDTITQPMKAVAKLDIKKFDMNTNTEEVKGMFAEFGKKLDTLTNAISKAFKPKNIAVTLDDGTIVQSDAADPNAIVGSNVTDANGAALADGTYETADGLALVVQGGKVVSADPVQAEDPMEGLKKENEALKKQLAEANAAKASATQEVQAVAKQIAEFKNTADELKAMKAEFEKIKNTTFGETKIPQDAPDKKEIQNTTQKDPMVEAMASTMGAAYTSSRRF